MPTVLIVGASGKICRHLIKALSSRGYDLILHCRKRCGDLREFIKLNGIRSSCIKAIIRHDFTKEGIEEFMDKVRKVTSLPPSIVVIGVGVYDDSIFLNSSDELADRIMRTNLLTHVRIVELIASWVNEVGGESVIIVLTDLTPHKGPDVYCGLKPSLAYLACSAGVHALIRSAPKRLPPNVRVVGVALGWVNGKHITEDLRDCIEASVPAGSPVKVSDVVKLIVSLIEGLPKSVNGAIIDLSNGL